MIDLSLSPNSLLVGQYNQIDLAISNSGNGACTHIVIDLEIPVPILVIRGNRNIRIGRLAEGDTHIHTLIVRPRNPGEFAIKLLGFSYRGSDGRIRSIKNGALPLMVRLSGESTQTSKPIEDEFKVELHRVDLVKGVWGEISGYVYLFMNQAVAGLSIRVDGPFETESNNELIPESGGKQWFNLRIKSIESGRVPAFLRILTPSGAILFSKKVILETKEAEVERRETSTPVVIEDSKVEIYYGDRTDVNISGDAVMTRPTFGNADPSSREVQSGNLKCPNCSQAIEQSARSCGSCGAQLHWVVR